jgi:hypothetical protein
MSYQVIQESHLEYLRTNSPNGLSGRISGITDMTWIFFQPSKVEENYQKTFSKVQLYTFKLLTLRFDAGLGVRTSLVESPGIGSLIPLLYPY